MRPKIKDGANPLDKIITLYVPRTGELSSV